MLRVSRLATVILALSVAGLLFMMMPTILSSMSRIFSKEPPREVFRAVSRGDVALLAEFIEDGLDVDASDDRDTSLLERAVMWRRKDVVELLIANGADVNKGYPLNYAANATSVESGYKPKMAAAALEIGRILLANGADPDHHKAGRIPSCLLTAARVGNLPMLRLLIDHGCDVTIDDPEYGLIMEAACYGQADTVGFIISKGGDPNQASTSGRTALHLAAMSGYLDVVEALIAAGAAVDTKDKDGETPLQAAEEAGHEEVAELLRKALASD